MLPSLCVLKDLSTRLQEGDLGALLDPALELEWLARPDPLWWDRSLWIATTKLIVLAAQRLRSRVVMRAFDDWLRALESVSDRTTVRQEEWRVLIASAPSQERRAELLARVARRVALDQETPRASLVALGQRLVALLPGPDPLLNPVLEVLLRTAAS